MKKYIAIILGAVFVLGFAVSAFAIHAEIPAETQAVVAKGQTQITIGGEMRFRGAYFDNNVDFDDAKVDRANLIEQRIRLSIHAKITPNTQVMVEMRESKGSGDDDYTWGNIVSLTNTDTRGVYTVGSGTIGPSNRGVELSFIQAWLQHTGSGLLGMPAGFKIGHMPLALGNGLFFDRTKNGEDALVLFADPTKELHLALVGAKFREGNNARNDDSTGYVGLFNYRTKQFGLSGDISYLVDQNNFGNTNPLGAQNGADAVAWNFGLRGDTKIGAFGLKADIEFQAGTLEDLPGEQDVRGYAFLVGVNYKLDGVNLALEYTYGSGDSDPADDKFKTFITLLDNKPEPPGSLVYNFLAPASLGIRGTGVANTQALQASVDASLTKDLRGKLAAFWLRANKLQPAQLATGANKDIGYEVDAYLWYKIDRNLTYFAEGGVLFADDFYKSITGGKDPDNAVVFRHGLIVSF